MSHDHHHDHMHDMHHDMPAKEAMAVDHTDHGSMHHMMSMYFHFGTEETVLFSFWKFSSVGGLIGSMIGIFILAVLYEGLKYYREYLFWRTHSSLQYRNVQGTSEGNSTAPIENKIAPPSMLSIHHVNQTFLHVVQIVVSYMLMLIFMTYNVWLAMAVALGSTAGFFLFGWKKKSSIVDLTEHCH